MRLMKRAALGMMTMGLSELVIKDPPGGAAGQKWLKKHKDKCWEVGIQYIAEKSTGGNVAGGAVGGAMAVSGFLSGVGAVVLLGNAVAGTARSSKNKAIQHHNRLVEQYLAGMK